jgi:hypothetical protein
MNIGQATALLGSNSKYFSDIAHLYNYKDDMALKIYLDFVTHEPKEWMRGFPASYTSKSSFGKPKTAVVKLCKLTEVKEALGEEYIEGVHKTIWKAYKQHSDEIFEERTKKLNGVAKKPIDEMLNYDEDEEDAEEAEVEDADGEETEATEQTEAIIAENIFLGNTDDESEGKASIHSIRLQIRERPSTVQKQVPPTKEQRKIQVLVGAYKQLLESQRATAPHLVEAHLTLLQAFLSDSSDSFDSSDSSPSPKEKTA